MKQLLDVLRAPAPHWVGDGFPVRSVFSYREGERFDPFLLLDYAGPAEFPPADCPRGVESHPHRGFETVTIVYQGSVAHRDSSGGGGKIGPGDVQWMTAAAGLVHEEMHAPEFAKQGGTLEMIQLWVNLPAQAKRSPPGYQSIRAAEIPTVTLAGGTASARLIAGELQGTRGAAKTFTPINVWDISLAAGTTVELPLTDGHTTLVFVRKGTVEFDGGQSASSAEVAVFSRDGNAIRIEARVPAQLVLLDGKPLGEPIAAQGPFVMNTHAEILQAIDDFRSGRMGQLH